jgi:hypothetical protein
MKVHLVFIEEWQEERRVVGVFSDDDEGNLKCDKCVDNYQQDSDFKVWVETFEMNGWEE